MSLTEFFYKLTPDRVLDAVEVGDRRCTGRFIVLNSYENRVYQLELDDGSYVVGKFYRPGRWTEDQIYDEHDFLLDLEEAEVAVAAPIELEEEVTLDEIDGIKFALFPRYGGRAPDEMNDEQLREIGRLIARIHAVGAAEEAEHRFHMTPQKWLIENLEFLLKHDFIDEAVREAYTDTVRRLNDVVAPWFEGATTHRIHGDCHLGNLLRTGQGLVFLDFDDMVIGPAVQDLWLLQGSTDAWGMRRQELLLEGYSTFMPFDRSQLRLIEPLRAMRMVHFSAWIARRWEDPAFPVAFPAFGTSSYWAREAAQLGEQLRLVLSDAS
jgi:Ser/Thr protein kinase RdoA (MazF antagonist)